MCCNTTAVSVRTVIVRFLPFSCPCVCFELNWWCTRWCPNAVLLATPLRQARPSSGATLAAWDHQQTCRRGYTVAAPVPQGGVKKENAPAPGSASRATSPHAARAEGLDKDNFLNMVLDKGHTKKPVFIYCYPRFTQRTCVPPVSASWDLLIHVCSQEERMKYSELEEKLKHEVRRTADKTVMRVLDVKAQPKVAKQLGVSDSKHWPVIISYSRGNECGRVAGHIREQELVSWVKDEAWLLNV